MKAVLYKTDGSVEEVQPQNGNTFDYKELSGFVDGMIEMIDLPSGRCMIVNEEGKLNGLEKNVLATELWKKEFPIDRYPDNNDELIVGNALVCEMGLIN